MRIALGLAAAALLGALKRLSTESVTPPLSDWPLARADSGHGVCVCVCVCVVGGEGVGRKFEKEIKIQMHWPGLIRRLPTECRP